MEPACKFAADYLPPEDPTDPVLSTHLRYCEDCQTEMAVAGPLE